MKRYLLRGCVSSFTLKVIYTWTKAKSLSDGFMAVHIEWQQRSKYLSTVQFKSGLQSSADQLENRIRVECNTYFTVSRRSSRYLEMHLIMSSSTPTSPCIWQVCCWTRPGRTRWRSTLPVACSSVRRSCSTCCRASPAARHVDRSRETLTPASPAAWNAVVREGAMKQQASERWTDEKTDEWETEGMIKQTYERSWEWKNGQMTDGGMSTWRNVVLTKTWSLGFFFRVWI